MSTVEEEPDHMIPWRQAYRSCAASCWVSKAWRGSFRFFLQQFESSIFLLFILKTLLCSFCTQQVRELKISGSELSINLQGWNFALCSVTRLTGLVLCTIFLVVVPFLELFFMRLSNKQFMLQFWWVKFCHLAPSSMQKSEDLSQHVEDTQPWIAGWQFVQILHVFFCMLSENGKALINMYLFLCDASSQSGCS